MGDVHVLKIGGSELANPTFAPELARVVAQLPAPPVIVHGGGKDIAQLQTRLGLAVHKIDGLRVTDAASLDVAEMVLSGLTNKRLVRSFLSAGVDAVGLSGIDGGLLRCRKKAPGGVDLGFVGEIVSVRAELISGFLALGLTVVISPISLGPHGQAYNVNADEAASAMALALGATTLSFVSNVPGVLREDSVVPTLTVAECETLIESGVVRDGMIPKVRAAAAAVDQGVPQARIVDLAGLTSGAGTAVTA